MSTIDPSWLAKISHTQRQLAKDLQPIIEAQNHFVNNILGSTTLLKTLHDLDRTIGPAIREAARVRQALESSPSFQAMVQARKFADILKPSLEHFGTPPELFIMPEPVEDPSAETVRALQDRVKALEKALIDVQIEIARKLPEVEDDGGKQQ